MHTSVVHYCFFDLTEMEAVLADLKGSLRKKIILLFLLNFVKLNQYFLFKPVSLEKNIGGIRAAVVK